MATGSGHDGRRSQGPTLQTVAELAGCSLMSVSRALNGVEVSPELAERIHRAAEEVGYVPNVAAQKLRGGRTKTIGVLINADFDPRTEIMLMLDSLINEMEVAGNQVLLSIARAGSDQIDAHLQAFAGRGVDGLFYWNAEPSRVLERYERSGVPVIAVSFRDEQCAQLPLVSLEAASVFEEMQRRLVRLGHRRGVELGSANAPAISEMFHAAGSLRWKPYRIGRGPTEMSDFVDWLQSTRWPPTVVMGDFPQVAELLGICEQRNISVPDDLSVVSIVDAVAAPLLRTPVSSLSADYRALGFAAAQAMIASIRGDSVGDVLVPDRMRWIERGSTGPVLRQVKDDSQREITPIGRR